MKIPTFRNFLYSYHSLIKAHQNRHKAITHSLEGKLFRCNRLWYIVLNSYSIETVAKIKFVNSAGIIKFSKKETYITQNSKIVPTKIDFRMANTKNGDRLKRGQIT
jgi:hypothetical protein